jgi:hypothetical protein
MELVECPGLASGDGEVVIRSVPLSRVPRDDARRTRDQRRCGGRSRRARTAEWLGYLTRATWPARLSTQKDAFVVGDGQVLAEDRTTLRHREIAGKTHRRVETRP